MAQSKITDPRFFFKPTDGFEYPRFFDAFKKCLTSVWNPEEVNMGEDLLDWDAATLDEKEIISGILRGFTQIECVIGEYWSEVIVKLFPKPEIAAMCYAFSFFEALHAHAYNHLSSTLGIDEFKAYYEDTLAQTKVNYLNDNTSSPKVKLAVFSAGAEGVALFSSFAVLLSFAKAGKFKGLSQIISWSILDEQKHSDEAAELFKELVKEQPPTEVEIEEIRVGMYTVVENEITFLDRVFTNFTAINGIKKSCFIEFIKDRANERVKNIGLEGLLNYEVNKDEVMEVSEWFYPLSQGNISQDFFALAKEGALYVAKPTFDRSLVDWDEVKNCLKRDLF